MNEGRARYVNVSQLRVGMFVQLDVGWMKHPFPIGSFRIASAQQIEIIRSLGLVKVRYFPDQSDTSLWPDSSATSAPAVVSESAPGPLTTRAGALPMGELSEQIAAQQRSLLSCQVDHGLAMQGLDRIVELLEADPQAARTMAADLVGRCVSKLLDDGESRIRLLPPTHHDSARLHSMNVMVLSLLLGKAIGMLSRELLDLGIAALLHDVGAFVASSTAPGADAADRPRQARSSPSHVAGGVAAARRIALSEDVVRAISEHHEMVDGSGFPAGLQGDEMSLAGKILALVNCYDNLCNPAAGEVGLTPYEALSAVFGQQRSQFDAAVLGAFIRMMGLYPPGSLVQLADDRYALVVAVNSSRPLRPQVIAHDAAVPREEALFLDLEHVPDLAIRRSVRIDQVPDPVRDYLAPSAVYRYFCERASSTS